MRAKRTTTTTEQLLDAVRYQRVEWNSRHATLVRKNGKKRVENSWSWVGGTLMECAPSAAGVSGGDLIAAGGGVGLDAVGERECPHLVEGRMSAL